MIEGASTEPRRRSADPVERRALLGCALIAGALLLAPKELVGAGICWALTLALGVWHLLQTRKEDRALAPANEGPQTASPAPIELASPGVEEGVEVVKRVAAEVEREVAEEESR